MKKLTKAQRRKLCSVITALALAAAGLVCRLCGFTVASAVLFSAAALSAGWDCVRRSIRGVFHGEIFDENMLMTIAAIGALLLKSYPECAAVMILYQTGELFQSIAVGSARKAISALSSLRPDTAQVLRAGEWTEVSADELAIGDTIRLAAGGRIPADCTVISGQSEIDTSPVTGESIPREALVGDSLFSGCINLTGHIEAKVTKTAENSAAGRIAALTELCADRKTKTEAFITRFAKVYTPCVTGIAAALAFVVPFIVSLCLDTTYYEEFRIWSYRALTLLVISCPCALVISVPLGYFCGLGSASKRGVLMKGSVCMDAAAGVTTALFDKTGTLTTGQLTVDSIECADGFSENDVLCAALSVECQSSHPIAKSIVEYAAGRGVSYECASEVRETAGFGVCGMTPAGEVAVGRIKTENNAAKTAVGVTVGGKACGVIYFSDSIKPGMREALASLKSCGVMKNIILTGDCKGAADAVCSAVGADEAYAGLMPEDKLSLVERYKEKGCVMFCGDGINDSPSLALADVGVAIGLGGTDAAVEAADAVLVGGDISRLADMLAISKKTVAVVKMNIFLSIGVKAVVLALGTAGLAGMWSAVAADVGVCILAVLNSLRLLRK